MPRFVSLALSLFMLQNRRLDEERKKEQRKKLPCHSSGSVRERSLDEGPSSASVLATSITFSLLTSLVLQLPACLPQSAVLAVHAPVCLDLCRCARHAPATYSFVSLIQSIRIQDEVRKTDHVSDRIRLSISGSSAQTIRRRKRRRDTSRLHVLPLLSAVMSQRRSCACVHVFACANRSCACHVVGKEGWERE